MHQETVRIVDVQMDDMSKQMAALDDFVAKARSHNGRFHEAHLGSLDAITSNLRESRSAVAQQLTLFDERIGQLQDNVDVHTEELHESTAPLEHEVRQPLVELRNNILGHPLREYVPTGITPQKRRYDYPTDLPRTESHDGLRSRHRTSKQFTALPFNEENLLPALPSSPVASPSKPFVYNDAAEEVGTRPASSSMINCSNTGLKEIDANVARAAYDDDSSLSGNPETRAVAPTVELDETPEKTEPEQPAPKRRRSQQSTHTVESKLPQKRISKRMAGMMEGRENVPLSATSSNTERRFYSNRPSH